MSHSSRLLIVVLFLTLSPTAVAQVPRNSQGSLTGDGFYHALSTVESPESWGLLPIEFHLSTLPTGPSAGNDGAAWQGKGFSIRSTAGLRIRWMGLQVTLAPGFNWAENADFAGLPSVYHDGWGDYSSGLDRIQRPGKAPFLLTDWGNTEVRFQWGPLTMGLGTESIWFGPGVQNAILLSDNAAGFPHLDLGLLKPWKTSWGVWEGRILWGKNTSFDMNTDRLFHGLLLTYQPSFIPELTMGFGRTFTSPWQTINGFKLFQSLVDGFWKIDRGAYNGLNGNDDVDQLVEVSFRLAYPENGFTAWVELARNDHSRDLRDFLAQPDHAAGYVAGFEKTWDWGSFGKVRLLYEQSDLGLNFGTLIRPTGSWYRHSSNLVGVAGMGYTHQGQLLGAAAGPGSNEQTVKLSIEWLDGFWAGVKFDRLAKDVDYLAKVIKPAKDGFEFYDVQLQTVAQVGFSTAGLVWRLECGWEQENNRYWKKGNDASGVLAAVSLTWAGFP